ncbi:MAG: hypothetical protein WAU01_10715 [Saprospiraceae bacterium]
MNQRQKLYWLGVLLIFALLEYMTLGYWKGSLGIYFSPIVFFMASMGVSVTAIYGCYHLPKSDLVITSKSPGLLFYILIPLLGLLIWYGYSVFVQHPIDNNKSDVFAQVLSPAQWLLQGQYPYQDVVLPTYTMHNTYLPMQWLPFVLSVLLDFDPRWLPVSVWAIFMLVFVLKLPVSQPKFSASNIIFTLVMGIMTVLGIFQFIQYSPFDFAVTLELLPTAYYILLVLALLRGRWWGIGLSMGMCLMSRFSIILLLPFIGWYIWKRFGGNVLWKSMSVTTGFILLIFVLPFLTKDPQLPVKILSNYDNGAFGEWQTHGWQEPGTEPYQLARGLGAAIFVKRLYEYDITDGVHHLKQASVFFSVLVGLFMIYLYQRDRDTIHQDWILLGGIKLYMTVFYTLVLIPYPYLFVLPITITCLILLKAYKDINIIIVRRN